VSPFSSDLSGGAPLHYRCFGTGCQSAPC
jgi:hypothetical protein